MRGIDSDGFYLPVSPLEDVIPNSRKASGRFRPGSPARALLFLRVLGWKLPITNFKIFLCLLLSSVSKVLLLVLPSGLVY